jgi:uncharacterized membrane protein YsdA (DUF1294 family)
MVWLFLTPFIVLCTLAPWISLLSTLKIQKFPLLRNLASLLLLLLLCFGISLSILRGVGQALFTKRAWEWTRTPKYTDLQNKKDWKQSKYQIPLDPLWIWELVFVAAGLWATWTAVRHANLTGLLILVPFTLSYAFVLLFSVLQSRKARA